MTKEELIRKITDTPKPFSVNPIIRISAEKELLEYEQKIRAEVIEEIIQKLNSTGVEISFNLPVEEILGEDIDLDDFAMLVQDAVQVYRKMVLKVLEQLKGHK